MKVLSVINNDKDAVTKEYVDSKAGVTAVDPTSGPIETDFFIPTKTSELTNDSGFITEAALTTKQDTLVSGTNIKTINNQSILGSGNVDINGGGPIELTSPFYLGDLADGTYIFPENSVMYKGTEAGEHELFAPYYNPDPTSSEPGTLGTGKGTLTITTGEYSSVRTVRYFTLEITPDNENWYKIDGSFVAGGTGLYYNAFLAPTFTQYAADYREVTVDSQTYKLPIVRDMANSSLPSLYRMRAPVVYSEGTGGTLYLQGDGYLLVKKYVGRFEWQTKFLALLLNKDTGSWEVKFGQWGDITLQTFELEKLSLVIESFGAQELTWINPSQETHQYAVGDLVTGNGLIFRCIQAHSNDAQNSHPYYAYYATSTYWETTTMWDVVEGMINDKQDKLISGTNIKTINNQSLLGSGNISVATASDIPTKTSDLTNDSGFITSSYHDNTKQNTLVSGTNIKTINNESLLGSGNITISGGGSSSRNIYSLSKLIAGDSTEWTNLSYDIQNGISFLVNIGGPTKYPIYAEPLKIQDSIAGDDIGFWYFDIDEKYCYIENLEDTVTNTVYHSIEEVYDTLGDIESLLGGI